VEKPYVPGSHSLTGRKPIARRPSSPRATWSSSCSIRSPQLELSRFYAPYEQEPRGAPPFDPAMLVLSWLYAYVSGVFEPKNRVACNGIWLHAIVGQSAQTSDHQRFRKRHLEACKDVSCRWCVWRRSGLVKLGNVATDGTKSRQWSRPAMSYGYMQRPWSAMREEIEALVTQALSTDAAEEAALGSRSGDALPAELPAGKTAWSRLRRPCNGWRRTPR